MSDTPLQLDAAALGRAQEETLEEMLVVVDNIDFAKAVPKKSAEFVLTSAIIFMRVSYNATATTYHHIRKERARAQQEKTILQFSGSNTPPAALLATVRMIDDR